MRRDGKRVKNVNMMYSIVPHIMPKRSDSCNSITVRIPYEPIREYIHKKRDEGFITSAMCLVLAAYVRTVAKYPYVNRFVVNKNIYARNDIWIGMVVKRPQDAEETMGKFKFERTDTIFEVTRIVDEYVSKNRQENANKTDALMTKLTKFMFLLRPVVSLLKFMDKYGLLPQAIIDASPFHCSMVITNLASIRTNYIHHHIYDFGTVGVITAMGNIEDVPRMMNGQLVLEKQIPLGIVTDERLCSGYGYAKVFAEMEKYLKNPELLETPVTEVNYDTV